MAQLAQAHNYDPSLHPTQGHNEQMRILRDCAADGWKCQGEGDLVKKSFTWLVEDTWWRMIVVKQNSYQSQDLWCAHEKHHCGQYVECWCCYSKGRWAVKGEYPFHKEVDEAK